MQELTAQVVKFEQEKNAKKMVEPPTEPEELERASTMNFGLVFEDHEVGSPFILSIVMLCIRWMLIKPKY